MGGHAKVGREGAPAPAGRCKWRPNAASHTSAPRVCAALIDFPVALHQKGRVFVALLPVLATCARVAVVWALLAVQSRLAEVECRTLWVRGPYVWPSGRGGEPRRRARGRRLPRSRLLSQGEAPDCPPLHSAILKTSAVRRAAGLGRWCVVHCRRRRTAAAPHRSAVNTPDTVDCRPNGIAGCAERLEA